MAAPNVPADWMQAIGSEFHQPYMQQLRDFLRQELASGAIYYPPKEHVFHAFTATPLAKTRVVIVGQDPYHGVGQAHGLSFSVPRGVPLPPSLRNIFKELANDLRVPVPTQGDLTPWAQQGVLLLNSVLTVRANEAASHQGQGWELFTDAVLAYLNQQTQPLVFLLWGAYAQRKGRLLDRQRHTVLTAAHPSPLSANRGGWFGCHHFSLTNQALLAAGQTPIDWVLT